MEIRGQLVRLKLFFCKVFFVQFNRLDVWYQRIDAGFNKLNMSPLQQKDQHTPQRKNCTAESWGQQKV